MPIGKDDGKLWGTQKKDTEGYREKKNDHRIELFV